MHILYSIIPQDAKVQLITFFLCTMYRFSFIRYCKSMIIINWNDVNKDIINFSRL